MLIPLCTASNWSLTEEPIRVDLLLLPHMAPRKGHIRALDQGLAKQRKATSKQKANTASRALKTGLALNCVQSHLNGSLLIILIKINETKPFI